MNQTKIYMVKCYQSTCIPFQIKKLFKPFNLRVSFSALESSLVLERSIKHVTVDWPLDCSLVHTCLSVKAKKKKKIIKDKYTTMQIFDVCKGPIVSQ